jgi:hypothetical protein
MVTTPKTIRVTEATDVLDLLDAAAEGPVILEHDGARFRLSRDEDISYEPDPERVRATLAATVGSWADIDVDQMVHDISEARAAGSRPFDRP